MPTCNLNNDGQYMLKCKAQDKNEQMFKKFNFLTLLYLAFNSYD